jgi:hypothetical protein
MHAGRARVGGREADARECARRKSLPSWSGTPRRDTRRRSRLLVVLRDRAGAGHHLWCGHPRSSAPRVNERPVNEQEARVPVWEEEYRQFCKRSLEGDNVYVWGGWSALQRTAFG